LRFAILGSGSRGNALVVECGRTAILIDCGFPLKEVERRLSRVGVEAHALSAVVLTHEHSDHASGARALARRHRIPLWLTAGTAHALGWAPDDTRTGLRCFSSHDVFSIGDIELGPFPVPHDAREPCQFVFSDGVRRLGLLTDVGHITPHIETRLRGCDALILECNHDLDMLADGPYPPSLKARVGGPQGHLDNEAAAALLAGLDAARLQHIVAAHLSEKNNTPWLARMALGSALGGEEGRVEVASQDSGLPWRELV
jgi:phosphoribosyl 1,2-cyclic phosphodiesterase